MTPSAILQAIGQRLQGMANCPPIVWPNKAAAPAKPYLVVQMVPGTATDPTLAGGGGIIESGQCVVTVVAELNTFSTGAEAVAANIRARFPKGLRPTAGLTITDAPRILAGYTDDTSYRVAVSIPWQAS